MVLLQFVHLPGRQEYSMSSAKSDKYYVPSHFRPDILHINYNWRYQILIDIGKWHCTFPQGQAEFSWIGLFCQKQENRCFLKSIFQDESLFLFMNNKDIKEVGSFLSFFLQEIQAFTLISLGPGNPSSLWGYRVTVRCFSRAFAFIAEKGDDLLQALLQVPSEEINIICFQVCTCTHWNDKLSVTGTFKFRVQHLCHYTHTTGTCVYSVMYGKHEIFGSLKTSDKILLRQWLLFLGCQSRTGRILNLPAKRRASCSVNMFEQLDIFKQFNHSEILS